MYATLAVTYQPSNVRLRIAGELGAADQYRLCTRFADILDFLKFDRADDGGRVELDLRRLRGIDPASLHLLDLFAREAVTEGRAFEVLATSAAFRRACAAIGLTHDLIGSTTGVVRST